LFPARFAFDREEMRPIHVKVGFYHSAYAAMLPDTDALFSSFAKCPRALQHARADFRGLVLEISALRVSGRRNSES